MLGDAICCRHVGQGKNGTGTPGIDVARPRSVRHPMATDPGHAAILLGLRHGTQGVAEPASEIRGAWRACSSASGTDSPPNGAATVVSVPPAAARAASTASSEGNRTAGSGSSSVR